jgi:tartrate-resistant acid phosphatase type 5
MKRNLYFILSVVSILVFASCNEQKKNVVPATAANTVTTTSKIITSKTFGRSFSFMIVSDWGWNGYKYQQQVADQMEKTADSIDAKFIVSCGDNFQTSGVASTMDPLWMSNFENVYKGVSLQADWYPVLGNHDYKGSAQAEVDYSKISRRWRMTDHYYTFARKINDSVSARFIFLDTPPLVAEYHKKPQDYTEIAQQDTAKEIKWLNNVLATSKEKCIIVFGHHPIYSASKKHGNTPEMIKSVKPILDKYHAQFYICGHDHDFQHLREKGHNLEFIVTGTGGEPRPSSTNEMSLFSKSEPGFSVISMKGDSIKICFVGIQGNIVYKYAREI